MEFRLSLHNDALPYKGLLNISLACLLVLYANHLFTWLDLSHSVIACFFSFNWVTHVRTGLQTFGLDALIEESFENLLVGSSASIKIIEDHF